MSGSPDPRYAHVKATLDALVTRYDLLDQRMTRGERQRSRFAWIWALTLLVALVGVALGIYILIGRDDSRRYYNDQIHKLACSVPAGSAYTNQLRAQYHCGPYHRPATKTTTKGSRG